jgi:hypothetical protein
MSIATLRQSQVAIGLRQLVLSILLADEKMASVSTCDWFASVSTVNPPIRREKDCLLIWSIFENLFSQA